jgi:carbon-monoxide dehydrogenase medium subunit
MILDGMLNVKGVDGERTIPLNSFFLAPGRTVLNAGEVVTSITLPPPPAGMVGVYKKLGRNQISDLSIVGVAVLGYPNPKSPSGYAFRIALASVAPVPMEALKAEAILSEKKIAAEIIAEAAFAAMDAVTPIDDVRGSARYRKLMVRNLTREALTEVWAKLSK